MGMWLMGEVVLPSSNEDIAEWLPLVSLCHAYRAFPGRMAQRVEKDGVVGRADLRAGTPWRHREISQSLGELQKEGLVLRTRHPEPNTGWHARVAQGLVSYGLLSRTAD